MTNPARMHLAHTTARILGGTDADTINCAPCNLGAGAILGNQLRNTRRRARQANTTTRRNTRTW